MAAIASHIIFDEYLKGISKNALTPSAIETGANNVGVALVGQLDDETITSASTAGDFAAHIVEDTIPASPVPCVKAIPANNIELVVSGTGNAMEVKVLASPVSFGANASNTTISDAHGVIVYLKTTGTPTPDSLADFDTDVANTKMVCYLDFGGSPVSSLQGPFKVTFNGGTADGETKGTMVSYTKTV